MHYAGIDLPDPKEGELVIDAVVLLQVMAPDGSIKFREWKSQTLHPIHALGMIETFSDTLRAMIMGTVRGYRGPRD